jgi:2'-5' RNA ligase
MQMNESFISVSKTIPYSDRDFVEWHSGISHYGFWAVLVNDYDWLALLETARSHVKKFLHPGYERAPHITVAACGLLSDEQFSAKLLECQTAALNEAKVPPFFLRAGMLDSFESAPYLTVEDPEGSLGKLRSLLAAVSQEDNPADFYKPHITLGLYREAFEMVQVTHHLQEFRPLAISHLRVTEVAFCAYETSNLQGPFVVVERVAFTGPDQRENNF